MIQFRNSHNHITKIFIKLVFNNNKYLLDCVNFPIEHSLCWALSHHDTLNKHTFGAPRDFEDQTIIFTFIVNHKLILVHLDLLVFTLNIWFSGSLLSK